MNDSIKATWLNHHGRRTWKFECYLDAYDRHFADFRDTDKAIIEIGVFDGGSLQVWRQCFPKAKIVGIDIEPRCKRFEEDGVKIFIGSQTDPAFLRSVVEEVGTPAIVIDDGGHWPRQQRISFETLFPLVAVPGLYVIEDLCMAYWIRRGGLFGGFMRYLKRKVDQLNGFHRRRPSAFTSLATGIHFYDSLCIVDRGHHVKPETLTRGTPVEPGA